MKEGAFMYETKKLYYEDVYKKEFTAKVLECRESKKGYEIILNQTAFYPEGGGQPSDTGILGGINVKEVHEKDGELIHYTDGPLEVGMDVIGKINWGRRFDLMQQHSGEHIVSGLVHEAFGYDNVGFHMGSDVITIDFNGMLDEEQMAEIEAKVNQIIWENQEVDIFYPTEEELKNLEDDRRKYRLSGKVRTPGTASNEMCTFLIINISSLQLIPVNVIAYRSQYGSVNPAAIVGAGIISTAISTAVAVIYCKIMDRS